MNTNLQINRSLGQEHRFIDNISIVAKCPGMAETVPKFIPMSRPCPGRNKKVLMYWNFHELYKP